MCNEHNLKIHSWNKVNKKLLCTQCIQLRNPPSDVVKIFPQAIREIKSRMLEAKELNKLRKMQLTQVMVQLTEGQKENRKSAERLLEMLENSLQYRY